MTQDYKHDYNNGQIYGWNGGECPVHPETVVRVWFRSGPEQEKKALSYRWTHGMKFGDIIAFQVAKPYVEPKEPREWWIWRDSRGRVIDMFKTKITRDDVHFLAGDEIIHVREVKE
jgi:hypothetical protein